MNAFARIDKAAFYNFVQRQSDGRYEYVRGRIVQQMTGGRRGHGLVAKRIGRVLEDQLDGAMWTVLHDRGVETNVTIRYPDVVVEPASEPNESLATLCPELIVEVLSPGTSDVDLDTKPAEYTSLATLQTYIVASQDEPAILIWTRDSNGRFPPQPDEIEGREKIVTVKCGGMDVQLPLAVIYEGIG